MSTHRPPIVRPLIAAATYQRPEDLTALVRSLHDEMTMSTACLVIIDNDPDASAESTLTTAIATWDAARRDRVEYVHHPEPGIAAVRNAALDRFAAGDADALVMVDDDETVVPGWLGALVSHANHSGAGVVAGHVVTLFPHDAPRWIVRGGFTQRELPATGTRSSIAASNTALLRRDDWETAGSPRFDPAFSLTGGSDTAFFHLLHRRGVVIERCAEAVVHEIVPPERLNAAWLTKRAMRNGSVYARVVLRSQGRRAMALHAGREVAIGAARGVRGIVSGRPRGRDLEQILRGLGVFSELLGARRIEEYRRTTG